MPHNAVDPKKTALLFFDMLNAYFRGSSEENQRKMEPIVANAAKVRAAAKEVGIPVFYAKADHRPDGLDSGHILSDTDYTLTPWPDRKIRSKKRTGRSRVAPTLPRRHRGRSRAARSRRRTSPRPPSRSGRFLQTTTPQWMRPWQRRRGGPIESAPGLHC